MDRSLLAIIIFLIFSLSIKDISAQNADIGLLYPPTTRDTIPDKQSLFNGRVWRSLYSNVLEDEFFLSKNWIYGDVVINDILFRKIPLKYDIYNDQLVAMINQGTFVQLNKELIKEFTLPSGNKKYLLKNFGDQPDYPFEGFGQVLYNGKICLVVKQKKQIKELAVENKYDKFYETQKIYLKKEDTFYHISGKKDLLKILSDKEKKLKIFLRENRIRIVRKNPESFIPAIRYYESLY